MKIFWDVTRTHRRNIPSGLHRVNDSLAEALSSRSDLRPVRWNGELGSYIDDVDQAVNLENSDRFVTTELFDARDRPGMPAWLEANRRQAATIFHDAIPLQFPEFTRSRSVQRHPGYLRMLTEFDRIGAVSAASADFLRDYFRWLGADTPLAVTPLPSGANLANAPRRAPGPPPETARFLVVGSIEPRKNQDAVISAAETLWKAGHSFELFFVGRVNRELGLPIKTRIRALGRAGRPVRIHPMHDDASLLAEYRNATASIFPSLAEGNGLPVLESLWLGVPVIASPVPSAVEIARGAGILPLAVSDPETIGAAMERILTEASCREELCNQIAGLTLPTWEDAADAVMEWLGD